MDPSSIPCPNCGAAVGKTCTFNVGSHFDVDPVVKFHAIRGTLAEMRVVVEGEITPGPGSEHLQEAVLKFLAR